MRGREGDDAFGIEPNWAAVRRQCGREEEEVSHLPDARLPNSLVAVLAVGISLSLSLSVPLSDATLSAKKAVRVGFADHKRNSGKTYGTGMTEKPF